MYVCVYLSIYLFLSLSLYIYIYIFIYLYIIIPYLLRKVRALDAATESCVGSPARAASVGFFSRERHDATSNEASETIERLRVQRSHVCIVYDAW